MGYNLQLTQRGKVVHTTDLCTNGGYSALCDWIGSLPRAEYPAVAALAADGEFAGTDVLAKQLNGAIYLAPPDDPDVLHVANRLADLLGVGAPKETVAIIE